MIISSAVALIFHGHLPFRHLLILRQKSHAEGPDGLAFAENLLVASRKIDGKWFTAWRPQRQAVEVSRDVRYPNDRFQGSIGKFANAMKR